MNRRSKLVTGTGADVMALILTLSTDTDAACYGNTGAHHNGYSKHAFTAGPAVDVTPMGVRPMRVCVAKVS